MSQGNQKCTVYLTSPQAPPAKPGNTMFQSIGGRTMVTVHVNLGLAGVFHL